MPEHFHMISLQFSIAATMIVMTVIAHALVLDLIFKTVDRFIPYVKLHFHRVWRSVTVIGAVCTLFLSHILHIWSWAYVYLLIEGTGIKTLEKALYFSTTTYTTLGYGDVILNPDWRLLGSTEAFNGIILLGLSTAALFELILRLYGAMRSVR